MTFFHGVILKIMCFSKSDFLMSYYFFFNFLHYMLLPRTAEAIKNHLQEKVETLVFYYETRRKQVT